MKPLAACRSVVGLLSAIPSAGAQCLEWAGGFHGPGTDGSVRALATFDDGSGAKLYAGEDSTNAGGIAALRVARSDGTSWSAVSLGFDAAVHALAVHDNGLGSALYAGGDFTSAGSVGAAAGNASQGTISYPQPGDPSISAQSSALGDPLSAGAIRYYQTYYRDPDTVFCPAPVGNSWNATNAVRVVS